MNANTNNVEHFPYGLPTEPVPPKKPWYKDVKKIILGAIAAFSILLVLPAACGDSTTGDPTPEPTETVEVTEEPTTEPEPAPEPATTEPTEDVLDTADYVDATLLLGITWQGMSDSEQADMCDAYAFLGSDAAFDAFNDGLSSTVNYDAFVDFFTDECGAPVVSADVSEDYEFTLVVLEITWGAMSSVDQAGVCESFNMIGGEATADIFAEGGESDGYPVDHQAVVDFFTVKCG